VADLSSTPSPARTVVDTRVVPSRLSALPPLNEVGKQRFAVAAVCVVFAPEFLTDLTPQQFDSWHLDPDSLLCDATPIYEGMSALELPFTVDAARIARGHIRRWLAGHDAETVNASALVVTELVSNAFRHATPPIAVHYQYTSEGGILIAVSDSSADLPSFTALTDEVTASLGAGGRGIGMTHRFAERIGWIRRPEGGKFVWALVRGSSSRSMASSPGR